MARVLIIDRFEGGYAICEEVVEGKQKKKKDLHFFGIEPQELPQLAKEGDVLVIGDDGTLTIDEKATAARKEKIKALQNRVWED